MNAIVSFCVGVIFIALSNDLGVATQFEWVAIICDVLGGGLIGVSCKIYMDSQKADLKNKEGILTNLNELSNKILTLNDLKDISGYLMSICNDNNEILTQISAGLAANKEFDNDIKTYIMKMEDIQKQQIEEMDNCVKTLELCTNNMCEKMEKLIVPNFKELVSQEKKIEDKIAETFEHIDECGDACSDAAEAIETSAENMEEIIEKQAENMRDLKEDLEYLGESIRDSSFRIMQDIRDYNFECSDNLADEIKKLSDQYNQFEKVCEGMIEQMTQMSESDYKIIKGMLNG